MAARPLPDTETLRKLLRYDPETGKLYWLPREPAMFGNGRHGPESECRRWNKTFAGKEAFGVGRLGYRRGRIFNQYVLAHRVVWALHYGQWPKRFIDHINGDRADNRLSNLREADFAQNAFNSGKQKNNTSGYKGVFRCGLTGNWRARIRVRGVNKNLGSFEFARDAHAAYRAASERYCEGYGRAE